MNDFSVFERAVLSAIASADRDRDIMRHQVEAARFLSREYTGIGFYTKFVVPEGIELLARERWKIEDMGHGFANHPSLKSGACFILWISEGKIITLEGHSNEGDWPSDETVFQIAA